MAGPPPTAIAGLDTAANRLHLYCNNGIQASYSIPDKLKMDPDTRRHRLYEQARHMFCLLPRRTLIACEEPLALKNGKTTRLLCLAAGAIWTAHLEYDVYWAWIDVAAWKKEVVGNGNANKDQIAAWVRENMGLTFSDQELDLYDAAAICRYAEIKLNV